MAPARRWSGASVAALATALAGCGSSSASSSTSPSALSAEAIEVPERRPTAGERLLELAPAGADALLEIDLARLRDNAKVGPLVRAVTGGGARAGLLAASDLLVFVSYRVGHDDAAQLVLAAGPRTGELAGARAITGDVVAIGPPALLDRVAAVVEGREPALAGDLELRRTRALAMPERAEGASVRMAARLGFDARVALASELDIEAVPAWLSIWLDVADDLALVALLGGDGEATPEELAQAVDRLVRRVAITPALRALGVARIARLARVQARGPDARVVLVIGPRRLGLLVDRVMARLAAPPPAGAPAAPEPDAPADEVPEEEVP